MTNRTIMSVVTIHILVHIAVLAPSQDKVALDLLNIQASSRSPRLGSWATVPRELFSEHKGWYYSFSVSKRLNGNYQPVLVRIQESRIISSLLDIMVYLLEVRRQV